MLNWKRKTIENAKLTIRQPAVITGIKKVRYAIISITVMTYHEIISLSELRLHR